MRVAATGSHTMCGCWPARSDFLPCACREAHPAGARHRLSGAEPAPSRQQKAANHAAQGAGRRHRFAGEASKLPQAPAAAGCSHAPARSGRPRRQLQPTPSAAQPAQQCARAAAHEPSRGGASQQAADGCGILAWRMTGMLVDWGGWVVTAPRRCSARARGCGRAHAAACQATQDACV